MPTTLSEKAKKVRNSSTLAITSKAKALKRAGVDLVSFGAGEPNFPTPENICDAAIRAIRSGQHKYVTVAGTDDARKAVCEKFRTFNHLEYEPDQIVISNGGKHALTNIFEALLNPGDEVIIPVPFWLSYPELIRFADGVPVFVNCDREHGYKPTVEQLRAAVTDRTKAMILNDPNNPTGAVYTEEELRAIGELAVEKDFYIVSDEMYEILTYDDAKHISIAGLSPEIYDRTITLSGLSKSYAMTGWRIGYTGSNREIAKLMGSIQSHQAANCSSINQEALIEALTGPQDSVEAMRREFDRRRKVMYQRICGMPLVETEESKGAFYFFVDFTQVVGKTYQDRVLKDAIDIADVLLNEYKVAVIPCVDFGCPAFIRLSYALSMEDIMKGLDRIEAFLKDIAQ